ncbi:ATP-binding protein [Rhodoferax sp.]|uniref:sensor histidine kinase n=1 Tax=Rhodoferax sp. TaxID=50421 RepID=UPI0019E5CBF0|nr:ATP-binding protein [Rhodoferax sp.]MBE0475191.1 HAMP domain-containing protein [Rhodoferax sp.]
MTRYKPRLSLFWRTFVLLALMLLGSVLAWTETLHELEAEPRAMQTGRQIASMVNLSRAAVMHTDSITQVSLFKTMKDQEHVVIVPREPNDVIEPLNNDELNHHMAKELKNRLGHDTLVAERVNGVPGLWIGFDINKDHFWLQTDRSRFDQPEAKTWLVWLTTAAALSLLGAAWMARLINRPLNDLSIAARRVREGDFQASQLDESASTNEIRTVNIGFNRMTQKLARIEEERAVMLAGISHDLRTPLARLRLEAELSVSDATAREHMANDIAQLDAIINKFLDYARPDQIELSPLPISQVIEQSMAALRNRPELDIKLSLEPKLMVQADAVELQRVITNLIENAARYGRSSDTGIARVEISAHKLDNSILLCLRDHGPGVPEDQLKQLTTPFFRGETARTAANGTGLGLAIVQKIISRMGGTLELSNASGGGLCASIRLQRAHIS